MFAYDQDSQSYHGVINEAECAIDKSNAMYIDGVSLTPEQAAACVLLWSWRNGIVEVEALLRGLQSLDK